MFPLKRAEVPGTEFELVELTTGEYLAFADLIQRSSDEKFREGDYAVATFHSILVYLCLQKNGRPVPFDDPRLEYVEGNTLASFLRRQDADVFIEVVTEFCDITGRTRVMQCIKIINEELNVLEESTEAALGKLSSPDQTSGLGFSSAVDGDAPCQNSTCPLKNSDCIKNSGWRTPGVFRKMWRLFRRLWD
jgi:hypothetical protein